MEYVELHCHSNYSFYDGASFVDELLVTAKQLAYPALALTDHDNLCGSMEFSHVAKRLDIKPIIGVEISLEGNQHITLLSKNIEGYRNISRLLSHSQMESKSGRLDNEQLFKYKDGLIALSDCRENGLNIDIQNHNQQKINNILTNYMDAFGKENFFVELHQNLVKGDVQRNKILSEHARYLGLDTVATNNVHYHVQERSKLQDVLVAIKNNTSLDECSRHLRFNNHFYLKSAEEMQYLFASYPNAIRNTLKIAEMCEFNLMQDIGYSFPDYDVPEGYSQQSYLEQICIEAARRKYGSISNKVNLRLEEEFRLIKKHDLAGFLLIYHDIIELAREVMIDLKLTDIEIPLEERSPGRGRGSSVAMLVGYLIGLSHIDPLEYNLSLNRFLPSEMTIVPDIDLDFPRNIREELIKRIHIKWGSEHAVLTGMFSTYKTKGAIRDIGKALALPKSDLEKVIKFSEASINSNLSNKMLDDIGLNINSENKAWIDLINLSMEIKGFPKYLAQHTSGMIISTSPISEMVPIQPAHIEGRYICQWDKKAIEQARFIKIDFLALGTLSQMQDILNLIERRTGEYIDLTRIDFTDSNVYSSMHEGDTIGIFQIESAAQIQTIRRIKPVNLVDMAYEVACVRPGVGVNDGVSQFIRRRNGENWEFDHELERDALERTLGIILFQDQVNKLAMDVGGLTEIEADELRRAFGWKRSESIINSYKKYFIAGANKKGVKSDVAIKIFEKFNGQYMFPESHAFAFGITAYHMAWLKYYYPLEFFVALFNQQPMGFYNLETLKEDAKRHNIIVVNPDINSSNVSCDIKEEKLLLGLHNIKSLGNNVATRIVSERDKKGLFVSVSDLVARTNISYLQGKNLIYSGALDAFNVNRRELLWELGIFDSKPDNQGVMNLQFSKMTPNLNKPDHWTNMINEYSTLGVYPKGHVMAYLRKSLSVNVLNSKQVIDCDLNQQVKVAGLIIRRQRPLSKAIFMTLEDEFGHIPLMILPNVYERYKWELSKELIMISGTISRREGTFNIIVTKAWTLNDVLKFGGSKNWQ